MRGDGIASDTSVVSRLDRPPSNEPLETKPRRGLSINPSNTISQSDGYGGTEAPAITCHPWDGTPSFLSDFQSFAGRLAFQSSETARTRQPAHAHTPRTPVRIPVCELYPCQVCNYILFSTLHRLDCVFRTEHAFYLVRERR